MNHSCLFRCSLDEIPRLRVFIRESLAGLDEVILNQIVLAADEVCTNAIIHGCSREKAENMLVTLNQLPGKVLIEITDSSTPFPITEKVSVDCAEKIRKREKGGLGLFLVQKIMDEISVEESGKQHVIRMSKYIR